LLPCQSLHVKASVPMPISAANLNYMSPQALVPVIISLDCCSVV